MKKYLIIIAFTIASINVFAQQNPMNEAMVYFLSGVTRNPDTTATITSQNILNVLSNLNIPTSNVKPAFPEFNEIDTTISFPEFPNEPVTKEMNRTKVYRIICIDTFQRNQLINNLLALAEVLFAEPNGTAEHNFIPSDTRFNEQWGLRNTTFPGRDIHAEQAWDIFRGTANNIIAIIDWGSNSGHQDLQAKVTGGDAGFNANNHGMHVAGTAAAISNNNLGISGVDHFARIHPKRMDLVNDDRGTTRIITDAVRFSPAVRVFNNSWGLITGRDEFGNGIPGRYSTVVRSAFATVYKQNRVSCVAMGNHNEVFGAGNRYANIVAFPAGFNSGLVAVGATNITDNIANFSARGQHIDVSAPGVNILSTVGNNDYANFSGTSMATPHVSGLASLLLGFNTTLANDDIEQIIRLTADDQGVAGFDNDFGTGRINAQRALQFLQAPNTVQHLSVTGGTVFSTGASQTRIFLGVPGLADAAYIVRRSEVRTNVTFPAMCNIIGVWGRGVGTTGYREENGRSFGEGICEVVPGTLTNTGCTLRTWIYEVWTANGQYIGFRPVAANNVIFQYTILGVPAPQVNVNSLAISGPQLICNSSDYSITNLPTGAAVTWSIPTSAGPVLQLSPNTPTPNQLRITNQKWYSVTTTLTAIISNLGCGIPNQTRVLTIANDNSTSASQPHAYFQEACTFYNVSHPSQSGTIFSNSSPVFVHQGCMVYVNLGNMTGRTVTLGSGGTPLFWAVGSTSYYQNSLYFQLPLGSGGIPFTFNINGNGACFQKTLLFFSYTGNARYAFAATPNPTKDQIIVTAKEDEKYLAENKLSSTKDKLQFIMNVYDVNTNTLQLTQRSSIGSMQHKLNVSNLKSGYYVLQILNGKEIQSIKFFKE